MAINSTLAAMPQWLIANGASYSSSDSIADFLWANATWSSLIAAATVFTIHRLVSTLVFHPLASIPGPWYAAISNHWLTSRVLTLQQCKSVQALFEKYGPVVRVGPNKVVFCDVDAMKMIYNVHKFDKGPHYKSLITNNNDHAMTTLPHSEYLIRRKAYLPHYVPSNLARFQPEIREYIIELIDTVRRIGGKQPIDAMQLFRQLMVDVISTSSYGYHIGAVSQWDIGVEHKISAAVSDFPKMSIVRSALPGWFFNLIRRIPHARLGHFFRSEVVLADFVTARIGEVRARSGAFDASSGNAHGGLELSSEYHAADFSEAVCDDAESKPRIPLLERLLQYKYPGGVQMPDRDILSEALGHNIAGVDTTSTSLAYFFWRATRQPEILRKLQAEVDEVMPDSRSMPELHVVLSLPYVNAFVKEGLRIYAAAPTLLERVVPASTTSKSGVSTPGFDLLGYGLPPGTIVATQPWSLHRDPSIFHSPEDFNPDRWLNATSEELAKMDRSIMAFGSGSRLCGGQNVANVMLRMVTVAISRNFDVTAAEWTNDKTMDIWDSFVIFPRGLKCDLIFTPREL